MPDAKVVQAATKAAANAAAGTGGHDDGDGKTTARGRRTLELAQARTECESRVATRTIRVSVDKCRLHPENMRDRRDLDELGGSMDTSGQEQAIVVQKRGDIYDIVDGGRRWMSAKLRGYKMIKAEVRPPRPDDEVLLATLGTDVHKQPLSLAERGERVERLKKVYGYSVADCAEYLKVSVATIYNWLRAAEEREAAGDAGDGDAAVTSGPAAAAAVCGSGGVRRPRRAPSTPVWKRKVDDLRRRWESEIGDTGLGREQSLALLAELAELAATKAAKAEAVAGNDEAPAARVLQGA